MAYESKVTNKYFGTTFAGGGKASVQETELSGLVKALGNSLPQLQEMGDQYIKTQEQEAATEITKLNAQGKSTEEIKKIIDSGENEALSSMYATATNNLWVGKLTAAEDIRRARENLADYNPDEQTMDEYLSSHVTMDFSVGDKYLAGGYASVFNEEKAKLNSYDAEQRFKVGYTKKVQGLANFIRTFEATTDEGISVFSRIDNTGYSKQQINEAAIQAAEYQIVNATTGAEVTAAMGILNADRGLGKNGMKLGSLISAGNKDAVALQRVAQAKRMQVINFNKKMAEFKKEDDRETVINDVLNGQMNLQQAEDYLVKEGSWNAATAKTLEYVKNRKDYTADKTIVDAFRVSVAEGKYTSQAEMLAAAMKMGIPYEASLVSAYKNSREGEPPIYATDSTYKSNIDLMVKSLSRDIRGEFNRDTAYSIRLFVENEILIQEAENPNMSLAEKREFMNNVRQDAKTLKENGAFGSLATPDKVNAIVPDSSVKRAEDAAIEKEKEDARNAAIKVKQDEVRATIMPKIETVFSQDTTSLAENVPQFDFETDTTLLQTDERDMQDFRRNEVYPYIAQEFSRITGITNSETHEMFVASMGDDLEPLVNQLAEAFGVDINTIVAATGEDFMRNLGYTPDVEKNKNKTRTKKTQEELDSIYENQENLSQKKIKDIKEKSRGRNK